MASVAQNHRRGEIYWVTLPVGTGSEQQGRRPVLIVQNNRSNRTSPVVNVVVVTTTPANNRYAFLVEVQAGEGGLNRDSVVNCAHVLTISVQRLEGRIGQLSPARMEQVDAALAYQLDL